MLIQSGWDTEKALEIVCDLSYQEKKAASQQKSQETRSLFAQQRMSGQVHSSNQFNSANVAQSSFDHQPKKPTKRRRAQFDGQQNVAMQPANTSPNSS